MGETTDRTSGRRLPRWAGEFVLIVAGVSVALGAESLWEMRQDRIVEREYLEQIRADLEESAQRLRDAISLEESQRVAAIRAFEAVAGGEQIAPDSARSWLVERRALFYSDPRLVTGTFTALLSTGDLRLLRDPALRQKVVGYLPAMNANMDEFDRWVGRLLEYDMSLRRVGLLTDAEASVEEDPSIYALSESPPSDEVLVVLDGVVSTNWARLFYLRRMLEMTDELAASLQGALE